MPSEHLIDLNLGGKLRGVLVQTDVMQEPFEPCRTHIDLLPDVGSSSNGGSNIRCSMVSLVGTARASTNTQGAVLRTTCRIPEKLESKKKIPRGSARLQRRVVRPSASCVATWPASPTSLDSRSHRKLISYGWLLSPQALCATRARERGASGCPPHRRQRRVFRHAALSSAAQPPKPSRHISRRHARHPSPAYPYRVSRMRLSELPRQGGGRGAGSRDARLGSVAIPALLKMWSIPGGAECRLRRQHDPCRKMEMELLWKDRDFDRGQATGGVRS